MRKPGVRPILIALVLTLGLTLQWATTVRAGAWRAQPRSAQDECNLVFDGEIRAGDLTPVLDQQDLFDFNSRICLNSPGGSLGEVLRFIQAATERDIIFATHIRGTDECLSSCALLFMFGQSFGANSPSPDRSMDPNARLGFHAPSIAGATGVEATEAFKLAIAVAKLLADRTYKATTTAGPPIPPELLSLVFGTPANEMRYVETIAELKLLGITMTTSLEDDIVYPLDEQVVFELMQRICAATYTLTFRQHLVAEGYNISDLATEVDTMMTWGADVQVHQLSLFPPKDYLPARIVGVLSGIYYRPGWNSVGASLYCRVGIEIEQRGTEFEVLNYNTDFDYLTTADLAAVPDWTDTFEEVTLGLLPFDTRYAR